MTRREDVRGLVSLGIHIPVLGRFWNPGVTWRNGTGSNVAGSMGDVQPVAHIVKLNGFRMLRQPNNYQRCAKGAAATATFMIQPVRISVWRTANSRTLSCGRMRGASTFDCRPTRPPLFWDTAVGQRKVR